MANQNKRQLIKEVANVNGNKVIVEGGQTKMILSEEAMQNGVTPEDALALFYAEIDELWRDKEDETNVSS